MSHVLLYGDNYSSSHSLRQCKHVLRVFCCDLTSAISALHCYLSLSSFLFPVGVLREHLLQDAHVLLQLLLLLPGQALHLLAKAAIQLPPPGPLILQLLLLLPPPLQLLHLQLLLLNATPERPSAQPDRVVLIHVPLTHPLSSSCLPYFFTRA